MKRPLVGRLTVAIGVLHTLATLPAIAEAMPRIVEAGFVGGVSSQVPPPPEAMQSLAALFSVVMGVVLVLLGGALHRLEAAELPLPRWLGPTYIVTGLVGGLLVPPTGFWLIVALGIFATLRAR